MVCSSWASPRFSASKYCAAGSARPASRVCLRANSTALTNSGNHGISSVHELLAAVDVVCRACDGGVRHEVDCQGGDVIRPDDAPDRQTSAQLFTALVDSVAE